MGFGGVSYTWVFQTLVGFHEGVSELIDFAPLTMVISSLLEVSGNKASMSISETSSSSVPIFNVLKKH